MAQSKRKSRGKTASPGAGARLPADADELLAYYREMLLIRRFEEKAGQLYGMGTDRRLLPSLYRQEAVCTGIQHAIRADDSVITGYRCHGFMLARGAAPNAVMAELAGRSSGVSKGKGRLDAHVRCWRGFFGGHGIVAAQVPIGVAWRSAINTRPTANLRHVFRRRGGEPGPGLRILQHGIPLGAPGRLRDRKQPVRDGHLDREGQGGRGDVRAGASPSAFPAARSTAWTSSRSSRRPRRRRSIAARTRVRSCSR